MIWGKLPTIAAALILVLSSSSKAADFIHVQNGAFEYRGKPLRYMGTNFWYGMNLGSLGPSGDRPRLLRELDRLKTLGITNLRIIAGTEGPDSEPWRISPALQKSPGVYDHQLLVGLDYVLTEIGKRQMHAVVMLSNFWNWSGGLTQYRNWAGAGPIPYIAPTASGDWTNYRIYASEFYKDKKAKKLLNNFVKFIIKRKNSITGVPYRDDPTIMAWELANEPSVVGDVTDFGNWIDSESKYIKALDSNHLVTTGSEGAPPFSALNVARDHQYKNIDYVTIHLWVQNWGWYDPMNAPASFPQALLKMKEYFRTMVNEVRPLNKPLVLEEFGLARDQQRYSVQTPVTYRDQYYREVFEEIYEAQRRGDLVSGVNFWAWGGEIVLNLPSMMWWKVGAPFTGEPPGEPQGWYSVFSSDTSTLDVISEFAAKINAL